jgi:hypothetical protein
MDILELVLICATSIIGWTLLYLDAIITFAQHPRPQSTALMKNIKLGLLNYTTERLQSYSQIRRLSKPHTSIHFFPANKKLNPPRGMDAWWKADILSNMKKHSLQDYFNPSGFTFEKYGEKLRSRASYTDMGSPAVDNKRGSILLQRHHQKDDIFSSDEDLDTSPLASTPMTKHRRATVPSMQTTFPNMQTIPTQTQTIVPNLQGGNISGESKQTVVDNGMSPREKVSGFISWDALKREETVAAAGGNPNVDAQRAFARMTRAETEGTDESASSWEREALGAGV